MTLMTLLEFDLIKRKMEKVRYLENTIAMEYCFQMKSELHTNESGSIYLFHVEGR